MASCLFPVKLCMKYGWSQDFAVDASKYAIAMRILWWFRNYHSFSFYNITHGWTVKIILHLFCDIIQLPVEGCSLVTESS